LKSCSETVDVIVLKANVPLLKSSESSGRQARDGGQLRLGETREHTQVGEVHLVGGKDDQVAHLNIQRGRSAGKSVNLRVRSGDFPRPDSTDAEIGMARQVRATHARLLAEAPQTIAVEAPHHSSTQCPAPRRWVRLTKNHSARPSPFGSSDDVLNSCFHMLFYFDSISLTE
jgi:hypothetical protein